MGALTLNKREGKVLRFVVRRRPQPVWARECIIKTAPLSDLPKTLLQAQQALYTLVSAGLIEPTRLGYVPTDIGVRHIREADRAKAYD